MATKAALRKLFLAQRKALSTQEVDRRSLIVAKQFINNILTGLLRSTRHNTLTVSTFLPIKRQNEVDTWLLIHRVWSEHPNVRLAAPVTDSASHTLTHYDLTAKTPFVENRWGILEPLPDELKPVSNEQFDVVLVPLLVFDRQGHRVGYGGGYYDRFLAECRPDCLKVGLSLFNPVDRIEDVEVTDVRLDYCIASQSEPLLSQFV